MKIKETHIVPRISENIRLQEYAISIFQSITTRSAVKKAIKKQLILINNKTGQTGDWILEGQKIDLLQPEVSKKIFNLKLEVLYENQQLAVINKPAGYPTSGNYFKTIKNALPFNLKPSVEKDNLEHPQPVHRLDNPTSGILICAKTNSALIQLNEQFQQRSIQKTYLAMIEGSFPYLDHECDLAIGGKSALTRFRLLQKLFLKTSIISLVEAKPVTGRTHQIRIHLAHLGFPILGETSYGEPEVKLNKGLFLASTGIQFIDPTSHEHLAFSINPPKKFDKIMALATPKNTLT